MQATLSVVALKPFIRALTCLSRYGDDVVICANPEHLTLSATNSSLSAYCHFQYGRRFFSRYKFRDGVAQDGVQDVKGQLLAKTFLSILKHKMTEKTVERCEFTLVEATDLYDQDEPDEDQDTLESRLIIRLHCKHGIVKTHRLTLLIPTSSLSPGIQDPFSVSRLTIGPRAIKDITEHFPNARGAKSDPRLIWTFGDTEVEVKTLESSIDTRGKAQLSTELNISADEFDVYDVYASPTTIAFHLREFNATIAFAESMGLCLDLRFTVPAAPLFIDVDGDESECRFVISTSQNGGSAAPAPSNSAQLNARKRPSPSDEGEGSSRQRSETPRIMKPMKAVQRMDVHTPSASKARSDARSMPPPSYIPQHTPGSEQNQGPPLPSPSWNLPPDLSREIPVEPEPLFYPQFSQLLSDGPSGSPEVGRAKPQDRTPLFYPLSQLSQADKEVIRASGLGIENMSQNELKEMLEGEGEEVDFEFAASQNLINVEDGDSAILSAYDDPESLELVEDTGTEFGPTQDNVGGRKKAFRPLFED
ncbi:Rad9-domain-containing protein [Suillus clintonianus]|uniref:Rad9-domain-containing protein n=1 Tax=Suillus clintonianus TaxID=1904413 RepID=UPI001B87A132|nr:Rad9-domain-containing protein [Suillus clintonianus]KAG2150578.1 Rad9-domain-containing protein [Suillus clintonianus]